MGTNNRLCLNAAGTTSAALALDAADYDKRSRQDKRTRRGGPDRADEWLKPTGLSIKERPMTVLAVVGGLAFAAGAFWMLKNSAAVALR